MTSETTVNCRSCRHYFITWDPRLPHGCRAMGFKSPVLPCVTVFRHSGQPCLQYAAKDQDSGASYSRLIKCEE